MTRILKFSGKVGDQCSARFSKDDTEVQSEGDIPHEFAIGSGDYVRFEIDVDTGKIVGFDIEQAQAAFDQAVKAGKYDPNGEYDFDD